MSLKLDAMPLGGQSIVFYDINPKEQNQNNNNYGGNGQQQNQQQYQGY
jgi:hypothetical protein